MEEQGGWVGLTGGVGGVEGGTATEGMWVGRGASFVVIYVDAF